MFIDTRDFRLLFVVTAVLLTATGGASAQNAAITYQGRLNDAGIAATATYDMQFKLFDASSNGSGSQVGNTVNNSSVLVTNGAFAIQLDFNIAAFTGADLWMEIGVRPGGSSNPYTILTPRQKITSAPYAIRSRSADTANLATTANDASQLGGLPPGRYLQSDASGNVGIGSNAPASKLMVQTTTGNYGFTHTDGSITVGSYVGNSASGAMGGWLGTRSNHPLHLFTNNGQPTMTIATNGNVGIGNPAPAANTKLAVDGAGNIGVYSQSNGANSIGVLGFSDSGIAVFGSSVSGFAGRFQGTVLFGAKVELGFLDSGGGTPLCLNGGSFISTCGSSLRYKRDITPFASGLKLLNQLRPIAYTWKDSGIKDVGLSAEDVATVEPLLVTHNSTGEVEGVKYDRLSAVFINAFKEQQAQLSAQSLLLSQQQKQLAEQQRALIQQQHRITTLYRLVQRSALSHAK